MKAATGAQLEEGGASMKAPEDERPQKIEAIVAVLKEKEGAWLPRIYRERILPLRTRSHQLPTATQGSAAVEVQHTLLGIELKIGRRRISCPDLATARYLAVFARTGVAHVAVPYDITKTSSLADELESAWQRMLLLAEHLTEGRARSYASRVRGALIREVRNEIERAGAGTRIPQFNQNTRQRRRGTP